MRQEVFRSPGGIRPSLHHKLGSVLFQGTYRYIRDSIVPPVAVVHYVVIIGSRLSRPVERVFLGQPSLCQLLRVKEVACSRKSTSTRSVSGVEPVLEDQRPRVRGVQREVEGLSRA